MWDVLIAGAGPAGSVAATLLARAGARVLIVDRDRFPRHKLCGDSVNPGTISLLRRLNLSKSIEGCGIPIDGMLLTGPRNVRVEGRYPGMLRGRTIRRSDFDWQLLNEAISAGAKFEDRVVVRRPLIQGCDPGCKPRVTGLVADTRSGGGSAFQARVTIAADGRRSAMSFGLGLAAHPLRPRRWAVGAYFEGVAATTSLGEMHIREGGYLGIAPLVDGLTNVCFVGSEGSLRPMRSAERVLRTAVDRDEILRDRFARARMTGPPVVLGPLAVDTRAAGTGGLLLAGDAAGFIDPITGDGLHFAIKGAELAAGVALEMLATGDPHMHVALARRRREAFAWKWRFNRTLRRLVDSPAALRTAAVASAVAPVWIRTLVAVAGDCGTLDRRSPNGSHRRDVDGCAAEPPHS
jgi:menaquinone-9 beta-reductase